MSSHHSRSSAPERRSLLDTRQLSVADLFSLFRRADEFAAMGERHGQFFEPSLNRPAKVVACLFFEASTRTRFSFQVAAARLGHRVITLDTGSGSSMAKGETEADTVLNVAAMKPDLLVVRYNQSAELDRLLPTLPMPVISAGIGTFAHPTQALLDAYTIYRERGSLAGQRILIVGDVAHSRVARSNFDVLQRLGAEIGICGPEHFLPAKTEVSEARLFSDLDEALAWATVYMGLRIQLERHGEPGTKTASLDGYRSDYHRHFGLTDERLKKLSKDAMIMHPGPINHGVEFSENVVHDPRSRVMAQVTNGVLIRAALLARALGESGDV